MDEKKSAPDAAHSFRSAALGPTLSHATPVAGDSRPRPVGDPTGLFPKPFGAQARHRGLNVKTGERTMVVVSMLSQNINGEK